MDYKLIFNSLISEAKSIAILGHLSPDGDCAGSVLGVYNYVLNFTKEKQLSEKRVSAYLEEFSDKFSYLNGYAEVIHEPTDKIYDLCIVCDCGDDSRLGKFSFIQKNAVHSFCLDHHITNKGFAEYCIVKPEASSSCEVLFDLLDEDMLDKNTAECIYTGIIHDTGVFRYSSTSRHTMDIAGKCMSFGFDFGKIIDDSFFSMSLTQKKVMGKVLFETESYLDGKVIVGSIDAASMKEYGVSSKDMDGIIDNLRTTRNALCAVFMYQTLNRQYKISMRSNSDDINVAKIAQGFGGGGHVKAAGCFLGPSVKENTQKLLNEIEKQLNK